MRIGVLGTGMVGAAIASKLVETGNEVMMGSRVAGNDKAVNWVTKTGEGARQGSFSDAAAFGEVVFNCTAGSASLDALSAAGPENLRDKILIDLANPLDFSRGMPPTLTICNDESLGERIQDALPETHVVKTMNTINFNVMVNPDAVPGSHTLFVSGNNADSKRRVADWLCEWFGWERENIFDLGDITTARGTEMYVALWVRMWGQIGHANFNIKVVRDA
ncbi:MAG: NAD(P)-binding domain-containing protein [Rhodothermales bacterium]|nr:NAD(P)-binding domain-containing protein [Rhodothermales bacterium]